MPEKREPQPCVDCGQPGSYGVDPYGVPSDQWRCVACYEQACRRVVREDYLTRYGR